MLFGSLCFLHLILKIENRLWINPVNIGGLRRHTLLEEWPDKLLNQELRFEKHHFKHILKAWMVPHMIILSSGLKYATIICNVNY
jgi:hypothetical protein